MVLFSLLPINSGEREGKEERGFHSTDRSTSSKKSQMVRHAAGGLSCDAPTGSSKLVLTHSSHTFSYPHCKSISSGRRREGRKGEGRARGKTGREKEVEVYEKCSLCQTQTQLDPNGDKCVLESFDYLHDSSEKRLQFLPVQFQQVLR
jgi:hypothetical protein